MGQGVKECNWDAVAALVIVGGGVQGLVQIANEVDQEAQGIGAFLGVCILGPQGRQFLGDGARDAALLWVAVFLHVAHGCPERDIDVMPWSGFRAQSAHVVWPSGGVGQRVAATLFAIAAEARIDGAVRQDFFGHGQRTRREMFFGQQGDNLMAFATPCARRCRHADDGDEQ